MAAEAWNRQSRLAGAAGQLKEVGGVVLTEQAGGLGGIREPAVAACCSVCWSHGEGFAQYRMRDCPLTGVVMLELAAARRRLRVEAEAELW